MKQAEALFLMIAECQRIGVSFSLEYDNGKRIPGKYFNLSEAEQRKHIEQGPTGFTIEIAGYFQEKDGKQSLYPNLNGTLNSGVALLVRVIDEQGESDQFADWHKMIGKGD
jgi:hypothetical protein